MLTAGEQHDDANGQSWLVLPIVICLVWRLSPGDAQDAS